MLKKNFKENIDKKVTEGVSEKVTEKVIEDADAFYNLVKEFNNFSPEQQKDAIKRVESVLKLLKLQVLLRELGMKDLVDLAIKDLKEEEECPPKFKVGDKVKIKHGVFENTEYFIDLPKNVKETDIGIIVDIDELGALSTYTVDFQRNVEGWGEGLKYWFLTEEELELI